MAMIVSRLDEYLAAHGRAALGDLARQLGTAPDALRGMLALLERKGRVRRLPAGAARCGGCSRCDPAEVEIYEWIAR